MFGRAITVGLAVLVAAAPATAQKRGTLELGGFASRSSYASGLNLNSSWGAGGRLGVFVFPRLSVEFEGGGGSAGRPLGLQDVNVGDLSARLTLVPLMFGRVSVLLGAGADHVDTYFLESYGVHGLLGAKLRMSDNVALRADFIKGWLANGGYTNSGLHLGLSIYMNPMSIEDTVMIDRPVAAPVPMARVRVDTVVRVRVDTVQQRRVDTVTVVEVAEQLVLRVQFQTDLTSLLPKSRPVLDTIAIAMLATPGARWEIQGHTDSIGTEAANKTLSQGRAQTVVDYLVSRGVSRSNLFAIGYGEDRPVFSNTTLAGQASNRRVQIRRRAEAPTGPLIK
jgi:outer membrane protein OmpA-like peptidoglycan-associated protein